MWVSAWRSRPSAAPPSSTSAIGTPGVASALVNTTQQIGGSLGTALLNTLAATATASYILSHGVAATQAGVVHGFAVAFAVGAGLLALGAVVSAIFISAGPSEVSVAEPTEVGVAS